MTKANDLLNLVEGKKEDKFLSDLEAMIKDKELKTKKDVNDHALAIATELGIGDKDLQDKVNALIKKYKLK